MIFTILIAVAGVIALAVGLASFCIHMTRTPPKNKRRSGVLPPPSDKCLRGYADV